MILILLGLAIVLATSSSLLAGSASGREGENRDESRSSSPPDVSGEIAGSVSVTSAGDVWLTTFIDDLSILAQIEVITKESVDRYRFSIVAVATPAGEFGAVSPHLIPIITQENRVIEFKTKKEAIHKIEQLVGKMGIVLSEQSAKSIPYAVSCGWRPPSEFNQIVKQLMGG
jgi:hypothetical protein